MIFCCVCVGDFYATKNEVGENTLLLLLLLLWASMLSRYGWVVGSHIHKHTRTQQTGTTGTHAHTNTICHGGGGSSCRGGGGGGGCGMARRGGCRLFGWLVGWLKTQKTREKEKRKQCKT